MISDFGQDRELVQLRSGGKKAVAEALGRYRDKLQRMIAFRLDTRVIGKVDGEDILQDAFVEATRRIGDYLQRPSVPVYVWFRQITMQVLIDTHRRYLGAKMRDVRQEVTLHSGWASGTNSASLAAHLLGSFTSPSQAAVRKEMATVLREALEQLNEVDYEVLLLRHLEELSNNEVAQVLGIDKYAASKRYLRALQRLRSALPLEEPAEVAAR
jgi:RNA polymerase sigma-70 factor (ECF subfamily)